MWNIVSKFVNDFGSSTTEVGKYWITMFNVLRNDLLNWKPKEQPFAVNNQIGIS